MLLLFSQLQHQNVVQYIRNKVVGVLNPKVEAIYFSQTLLPSCQTMEIVTLYSRPHNQALCSTNVLHAAVCSCILICP